MSILIYLKDKQEPIPIKTIIFDIGDTLIDLQSLIETGLQAACRELLRRRLLTEKEESRLLESYRKVNQELSEPHLSRLFSNARIIDLAWKRAGLEPLVKAYALFLTAYRAAVRKALKPNAQLIALLEKLRTMDVQLGIISDGAIDDLEVLVRLQIIDYFDHISISEAFGREKVDESIFQYTLVQLQANPETSLMVGDNMERDIRWAKRIGMKAVLVLKKPQMFDNYSKGEVVQPDLVLRRVCDLYKYIEPRLNVGDRYA